MKVILERFWTPRMIGFESRMSSKKENKAAKRRRQQSTVTRPVYSSALRVPPMRIGIPLPNSPSNTMHSPRNTSNTMKETMLVVVLVILQIEILTTV